jgi:DNA-binding transcriptional ArsR family regulator
MTKKSFLLVSLNESKTKKLAEVISNNTCRKMLDYLASKQDATESDMAKELGIPISTVNYNMKALLEAKLVKSDEYHYSPKGKEVSHYKLANQYVIIAPEGEKALIREKLRSIIPTALIMGAAAAIIKLFSSGFMAAQETAAPLMMKAAGAAAPAAEPIMQASRAMADEAVAAAAPTVQNFAAERAPEVIETTRQVTSHAPEIALWFFIGAVSSVAVYLLIEWLIKKIKRRRSNE